MGMARRSIGIDVAPPAASWPGGNWRYGGVVGCGRLHAATAEVAAGRVMQYDPAALQAAKMAIIRGLDLPLPEGIKLESQYVGLTLPRRKKG